MEIQARQAQVTWVSGCVQAAENQPKSVRDRRSDLKSAFWEGRLVAVAIDSIREVKAVVAAHEALVRAGDLDGILGNFADDSVLLAPNVALVQGKQALRELYAQLLGMGAWDFVHEYDGAEVIGDFVVLHGVALGTLSPPGGQTTTFANNFIHIWRKETDGRYRLWRGAFAPTATA